MANDWASQHPNLLLAAVICPIVLLLLILLLAFTIIAKRRNTRENRPSLRWSTSDEKMTKPKLGRLVINLGALPSESPPTAKAETPIIDISSHSSPNDALLSPTDSKSRHSKRSSKRSSVFSVFSKKSKTYNVPNPVTMPRPAYMAAQDRCFLPPSMNRKDRKSLQNSLQPLGTLRHCGSGQGPMFISPLPGSRTNTIYSDYSGAFPWENGAKLSNTTSINSQSTHSPA